jgi:hypothetical protein|tara:strand:- start:1723 stop:1890 length:168 start_codon:yes stop_codon:yes gene_type:complete
MYCGKMKVNQQTREKIKEMDDHKEYALRDDKGVYIMGPVPISGLAWKLLIRESKL